MIFGWDISTSVVGLSVLKNDGTWVESSYFDFGSMAKGAKNIYSKMKQCEWWIEDRLKKYKDDPDGHMHFFEDRLANFSKGFTRLQTLMMLAAFNAMFSYRVLQVHSILASSLTPDIAYSHLHPSTVKATMKKEGLIIPKGSDKKQMTLHFVRRTVQQFPVEYTRTGTPKPFCYDMADAFIVARAGYLRKYLSKNAKGKEVESLEDDSGPGDDIEG